jgi:hypothetical protein
MGRRKLARSFTKAQRQTLLPRGRSILSEELAFGMGFLMRRRAAGIIFPLRGPFGQGTARPLFGSGSYRGPGRREAPGGPRRRLRQPARSSASDRIVRRLPAPARLAVTGRLPGCDLRCVGWGEVNWGRRP